jgi:hypothetical protein
MAASDPPGGNERLAGYIGRRKLYQLSREELLRMSPEDIDTWPNTGPVQSISEQADLRGKICRLAGLIVGKGETACNLPR